MDKGSIQHIITSILQGPTRSTIMQHDLPTASRSDETPSQNVHRRLVIPRPCLQHLINDTPRNTGSRSRIGHIQSGHTFTIVFIIGERGYLGTFWIYLAHVGERYPKHSLFGVHLKKIKHLYLIFSALNLKSGRSADHLTNDKHSKIQVFFTKKPSSSRSCFMPHI